MRKLFEGHAHFRQSREAMRALVKYTSPWASQAIVMPNLTPPVIHGDDAVVYHKQLTETGSDMKFHMTLFLSPKTKLSGSIKGVKWYDQGVTTHSEEGVKDWKKQVWKPLAEMQDRDIPLLIHAEVGRGDPFTREQRFIRTVLPRVRREFPRLRIVLEHLTTKAGVAYVQAQRDGRVGATITAHHLWSDREAMFSESKLRPHAFCLPVLKTPQDQKALREAAWSGDERFWFGSDSAAHPRTQKESSCGCAGCFTAPVALPMLLTLFEGKEWELEQFACLNGPRWYGLEPSYELVKVQAGSWTVPESYAYYDTHRLVPFLAGQVLRWKVVM